MRRKIINFQSTEVHSELKFHPIEVMTNEIGEIRVFSRILFFYTLLVFCLLTSLPVEHTPQYLNPILDERENRRRAKCSPI